MLLLRLLRDQMEQLPDLRVVLHLFLHQPPLLRHHPPEESLRSRTSFDQHQRV